MIRKPSDLLPHNFAGRCRCAKKKEKTQMNVGNDSRNQTRCWSRYKLILGGGGDECLLHCAGERGREMKRLWFNRHTCRLRVRTHPSLRAGVHTDGTFVLDAHRITFVEKTALTNPRNVPLRSNSHQRRARSDFSQLAQQRGWPPKCFPTTHGDDAHFS